MEVVDIDKLVDIITNFCNMVLQLSDDINEIDINPVAIKGDRIIALDALMVRSESYSINQEEAVEIEA